MSLLPAEVPDIPELRSGIVPARLARKVAPLFGIAWEQGPFGTRTWVSDYSKITLSEIARGAPLPTRTQAARIADSGRAPDGDRFVAAAASLPNEIANATLSRFGPDTKAAVVLTAANRLLRPVTDAMARVLPMLTDTLGRPLPVRLRLAAWAGLVIETFRSQPALVAAAIRARAIQRELVVAWELPLARRLAGLALTRCEIGANDLEDASRSTATPDTFDLVDRTIDTLGLPVGGDAGARDPRHDELVERLLRSLLEMGTPRNASHLWLSERQPRQLVVEAFVAPTNLINLYVTATDSGPDDAVVLPRVPDERSAAELSVLERRVLVLGLLTVLRQLRFDIEGRERTRAEIIPTLDAVSALTDRILPDDDPVRVVVRCHLADMRVHTLRQSTANDLRGPLDDLAHGVRRCTDLLRRNVLDRGAAAEAIGSACVEINAVRWTNATDPAAGLPDPAELDTLARAGWATFHEAMEIDQDDPAADARIQIGLAGYHLHNYAAFLASHVDDVAALTRAVTLFETVVLPARERFFEHTKSFLPLRHSLQVASRGTTRLGELARTAADLAGARGWAERGRAWIVRALAHAQTTAMLDQVAEPSAHFALRAAPALLLAVELGTPGTDAADVRQADRLVGVAEAWQQRVTDGHLARYPRHDEVVALRARVDRASA